MLYDQEVINEIKEIIASQQATISVAESVTSGHLQAALSSAEEASAYFQGGITCYNLGQKVRHLDIEPTLAQKTNCIHQLIANNMAIAACKMFLSRYAIAITGYASIVPECETEGLYAYFAVADNKNIILQSRLTSSKENPVDVQVDYANQVLRLLLGELKK